MGEPKPAPRKPTTARFLQQPLCQAELTSRSPSRSREDHRDHHTSTDHHLPHCSPTPNQQQKHQSHPKYLSLTPPDEPQTWGSLVSTSKLLQRGPELHPALAVLLKEGNAGLSGGIWCIYPLPQTLSHLGRPPAGRTVANHQPNVQGGVNAGRVKKHVHSKNEVAELRGGMGRWF